MWAHDKLYMTNYLANIYNESCLNNLPSPEYTIQAKDCIGGRIVNIPDQPSISGTGNLPKIFKIKVGARVMLTDNMDLAGCLINGSTGTVVHVSIPSSSPLSGVIYVTFDDKNAGSSLENFKENQKKQTLYRSNTLTRL